MLGAEIGHSVHSGRPTDLEKCPGSPGSYSVLGVLPSLFGFAVTIVLPSVESEHSGDSKMIGDAWADCLAKSHRDALNDTLCILVDDFLNDPEDISHCIAALPPKFLYRYDGLFRRKFLVTLLTVGYKLALTEPPAHLLSCTAEELALYVLIEEARGALMAQEISADFSEFEDKAFQDDMDIMILYDMSLDGIEDSPVDEEMAFGNLQFDKWFEPFLNASTPVHPYTAEDRSK